ncbi:phytoene desaturase family protein [Mycolicibacterium brumae]|uniref:NAD(P)/FAD-dependent oxidoreductase n=1 Tax=Mycolicibacterium brumae TaxID=85968 RepID=A0A2G5PFT3_9MYCO|nr:NAD(P)/FAD-dependent oxidoreductase [Mycolicibacterium brumae]MCV7191644.1 NAD(P)/FAD-dependent oxidoreductase [Mycolicibacterium brumae]PIB76990.1 NAD(P)/FAD-dependent oxidoreductase [Mycolicibacterium brumae]UWW07600.1 NAD(P)/FAD-dependent oxidoreductase [Mycolicibacterium brumae]
MAHAKSQEENVDVVVVGGGHNALVAAGYLARAGLTVRLLERLDYLGGAAVSAQAFPGVDARLSRYSYLVSLLPPQISEDLGAPVELARREWSSYTPNPSDGGATGLLIGPRSTFDEIGAAEDEAGFHEFNRRINLVARGLWPTLLEPLRTRSQMRELVLDQLSADDRPDAETAWTQLTEAPIGSAINAAVRNDLVRGVLATDALIGTFADVFDPSLAQNICFLYHLIGGGTGDWDVPVGGMGAVTGALAAAAQRLGAELVTEAEVLSIDPDGSVRYLHDGAEHQVRGKKILAGCSPAELARLLGEPVPDTTGGAQVKVNLMLRRLPKLRDESVAPEQAFGGTFHINETLTQLTTAHGRAAAGVIPNPLPCEIYCHSLTDPSILGPELQASGAQTLTVFGLHAPHSLLEGRDPDAVREELKASVLASLNSVLAEPIEDVLYTDGDGNPCVEAKTTADLDDALRMTSGNIFHGALGWPFVEDDEVLETPAQRWGVATAHPNILLCGSGSRRGGAVSGLGGHNAAMATLEELQD